MNPPKETHGYFSRFWTRMSSCFRRRRRTMDLETSPTPKWTMMHSFLAVMGGFVVEMNNQPRSDDKAEIQSFLPWKSNGTRRTRLTMAPEALAFFKEKNVYFLIPKPSLVHIQDKSKGDTLAKEIVCLQVSWLCAQCFTRFAQGLAASLLELNTFGHAVCTLIIYSLWWSKPLSIDKPEKMTFDLEGITVEAKLLAKPLFLKVDESEDLLHRVQMAPAGAKEEVASDMKQGNDWDSIELRGAGFFDRPIDDSVPARRLEEISRLVPYVRVLHSDDRIGNFPRFGEPGTRFGFCLGFSIFGFIYGGLHYVAWNAPFLTEIEKTLWRVSSLAITATIIPVFLVASWSLFPPFWQDPLGRITEIHTVLQNIQANVKPEDWISLLISWVMWIIPIRKIGLAHVVYILLLILFFVYKVIFDTIVMLLLVIYTLTRLYLVVVCFINLAHLPDSAYLVPNWSRYVPHIG
ncbi:hypothetical protein NEUTE2DRAFT_123500 [Neurospora tetrasperma FGSC 2509]|nr:hypothetical protein NEUTE2DRAFT_123500 [Neurospora tetrasperma FGSC 2509]